MVCRIARAVNETSCWWLVSEKRVGPEGAAPLIGIRRCVVKPLLKLVFFQRVSQILQL